MRRAAIGNLLQSRITTARVVCLLADTADNDPDPEIRDAAENMVRALDMSSYSIGPKVDPKVLPLLEDQAKSKDAKARGSAVRALGCLHRLDPIVIDICVAAFNDNDASLHEAAVAAASELLSFAQGTDQAASQAIMKALTACFDKDLALREKSGLALYLFSGSTSFIPEPDPRPSVMSKLLSSADRNDRGLGAVLANHLGPRLIPTPGRALIAEAVHNKYFWVRAIATNELFVLPTTQQSRLSSTPSVPFPVDSKAELLSAILDPNPDVARDAALYLSNALPPRPPRLSWSGMKSRLETLRPQDPPAIPSAFTPALTLCKDVDPAKRLAGLSSLQARGAAAVPAVPQLTTLLDDRDPKVKAAAQQAIHAILAAPPRPAGVQGQPRPTTMQFRAPTTQPYRSPTTQPVQPTRLSPR